MCFLEGLIRNHMRCLDALEGRLLRLCVCVWFFFLLPKSPLNHGPDDYWMWDLGRGVLSKNDSGGWW